MEVSWLNKNLIPPLKCQQKQFTVKPVTRGHLWNKEEVAL